MTSQAIFRSSQGEALIRQWYQRFLERLPYPLETRELQTHIGQTRVLVTGPENGSPLLLIHGALAGAPHALGELGELPTRYRVYAVDVPGQSVGSVQRRLNVRRDEHARWLAEVLDLLGLEQIAMLAVSWGGFVALNFATHYPERVTALMLLTPAGVIQGSAWQGTTEMMLPMLRYRLFPSLKNRDRLLKGLFTAHDDFWSGYIGDAMLHITTDFTPPPLLKDGQLNKLKAPVYIYAADRDVSFPGKKLLARAREVFPNLVGTKLLTDCRHCPPFDQEHIRRWSSEVEQVFQESFRMPATLAV